MTKKKVTTSGSGWKHATTSERDTYREEREGALRELDSELDQLKKKALEMTLGTREDLGVDLRALRERRRRFVVRLAELREVSGDAWWNLKSGVDSSWDDLEDAVCELRRRVHSAIRRPKDSP